MITPKDEMNEPQESDRPDSICPACETGMDWSDAYPGDIPATFDCPGCGAKVELELICRTTIVTDDLASS